MGGRKANMEDRGAAVRYLLEHRRNLLEKREHLARPLREVDDLIEHVDATLRSIQRPAMSVTATVSIEFPIGKLRGLTQVQALTVIAKHHGGTFKAQEAKRLLIRAGVMRETKNSTNTIHAVIRRSEKFDPVRPGEYRLKADARPATNDDMKRAINPTGTVPLQ